MTGAPRLGAHGASRGSVSRDGANPKMKTAGGRDIVHACIVGETIREVKVGTVACLIRRPSELTRETRATVFSRHCTLANDRQNELSDLGLYEHCTVGHEGFASIGRVVNFPVG